MSLKASKKGRGPLDSALDSILGVEPSLRLRKKVEAPSYLKAPESYSPKITNEEFYWVFDGENPEDPNCKCQKCSFVRKQKSILSKDIFGSISLPPRRLPFVAPARFITLAGGTCRLCLKRLSGEVHTGHEPSVKWILDNPQYSGPVILHPVHPSCHRPSEHSFMGNEWVQSVLSEEGISFSPGTVASTLKKIMEGVRDREEFYIPPSSAIALLNAEGFNVSQDDGVVKRARRLLGITTIRKGRSYLWHWDGQTNELGRSSERKNLKNKFKSPKSIGDTL